jgi:steroid delta-isomerase-like uncharacterized protein
MRKTLMLFLLLVGASASAENMTTNKKNVVLWYEAFDKQKPALIDQILSEQWEDIPAAPGQQPGREFAKKIVAELWATFPDFSIKIKDVIAEGNKVVVRSEISGTQKAPFMGFPVTNRRLIIQAIDIHEFKNGKIVRSWHVEDWMSGLRQLGVFGKQP